MTFHSFLRSGAAVALTGLLTLAPAAAQDAAPASGEVLATVGDTEITRNDVDLAVEMFGEQLAQVPEDQRTKLIVDALIDMHLVAEAARGAGMADTEQHEARMEFLENQALRAAYIEDKVQEAVTEEELRARYEQDIASYTPPEEVNASHILVETEEEAKAILEQLAGGADFAEIAREKSLDPGSKQSGGELGFFAKGQMVPEFEAEAFSLPPGEVSKEPVKTQFGYHIVKVNEKRSQPVPSFEDVRDQILPVVQREKFEAMMTSLRDAADVERFGAATEAAEGEPAEGEPAEGEPAEGEETPAAQ